MDSFKNRENHSHEEQVEKKKKQKREKIINTINQGKEEQVK